MANSSGTVKDDIMRYAMIGLVMAVLLWRWLREQRALSAGAIGAGGGAAIGAITSGDPLTGALIGGAVGAAIGTLMLDGGHRKRASRQP